MIRALMSSRQELICYSSRQTLSHINMKNQLYYETPLLYSNNLSKIANADVYLKLENTQPAGSFKSRGMGYFCQKEIERGTRHFVCASAGNAGVAVATIGKTLNMPVTVFVPRTSPKLVTETIIKLGQQVEIHGENLAEANERAIEEGKKPGCSNLHPYLHPDTWDGHSSMIDEIATQLGQRPGCILVSVGGGGLLAGLLVGIDRHGWHDVPVLAFETLGADCFNQALAAGKVVEQEKITSLAHTLGARSVPQGLLDMVPKFNLTSYVVTDSQAVESCIRFADDQRMLVEPSCGASLAAIYCGILEHHIKSTTPLDGPVVAIICGGSGINLSLLQNYAKQCDLKFPS